MIDVTSDVIFVGEMGGGGIEGEGGTRILSRFCFKSIINTKY
jgi:hypothetical protein